MIDLKKNSPTVLFKSESTRSAPNPTPKKSGMATLVKRLFEMLIKNTVAGDLFQDSENPVPAPGDPLQQICTDGSGRYMDRFQHKDYLYYDLYRWHRKIYGQLSIHNILR